MKISALSIGADSFGKIIVYDTKRFGKGIKASRELPGGEVLMQIRGPIISYKDTVDLGERESYCLQIGNDKYIFPDYPFYIFNHSCDPNCGINDALELVTIRPVKQGEPLTWDYSTSMLERGWKLKCSCQARTCRQVINDFDTLPVALQEYYLDLNIVLPYIAQHQNHWRGK